MNLNAEAKTVSELAARLDHLQRTEQRESAELAKAEKRVLHTQAAQEILQLVAQAVQQQVHERMSKVVSSCLSAVFGEEAYEFKIVFERKRGRTEASLRFTRRGLDIDPMTASGGGAIDVAAFALRVACLVLHRPRLSRILVLDEPFRFVSAEYQDNVRTMLEQLSADMGVQLLMVTHNEALATGKIIEL